MNIKILQQYSSNAMLLLLKNMLEFLRGGILMIWCFVTRPVTPA